MKMPAIILLLLIAGNGRCQEIEGRPLKWHARIQTAGYQGLVSVGAGPSLLKGRWLPGLMYGYAPAAHGRSAVHQIILRNDVIFLPGAQKRSHWFSPSFSANLLLETGEHTYLRLPDEFAKGYYFTPQLHGTFGVGAVVGVPFGAEGRRTLFVTAEAVALDTYLWYSISQRGIPITRAFGLSLAVAVIV